MLQIEDGRAFNVDQQAAIEAGSGVWQVLAGPGSGKTAVLVERYRRLARFAPLCLTFTVKAAEEMKSRARGGNFKTIGSAAYQILKSFSPGGFIAPPVDQLVTHAIEILDPDRPRFKYVMIDEAQDCSEDDWEFIRRLSPNIFAVGDAMQCVYGFRGSQPELFLNMAKRFPGTDTLYLGRNYRCHPPGVTIECCTKRHGGKGRPSEIAVVPIDKMTGADRAIPYQFRSSGRFGLRLCGRKTDRYEYYYKGDLVTIKTRNHEVPVTPNHKIYVKFNENSVGKWIVYLMWRKDRGYRIGQCGLVAMSGKKHRTRVIRFWHRLHHQKPDKVWILQVTENRKDSLIRECVLAAKYGILQTEFEPSGDLTIPEVERIFSEVPHEGGHRCLTEHDLSFDDPLLTDRSLVAKSYFLTAAGNAIPSVMSVPTREFPLYKTGEEISEVARTPYDGPVHALSVETDHNYFANGILVGNSTQQIVEFCTKIAPVRGALLERLCSENEPGAPVETLSFAHNVEEAEFVIGCAQSLQRDSLGSSVALARTRHQLDVFSKLGAPDYLELSTVHAAKGKEWDNVFVIGTQQGLLPFRDGDIDEESRILFVAASRARKRLILTRYGTPSILIH